jgi:SAM-dependent methyltransferase
MISALLRVFRKQPTPKIEDIWGTGPGSDTWRSSERVHWTQHPKVQERLNRLVSGDPARNRFEYFMDRYLAGRMPVARALTLGSGLGELERGLAQYNFATLHEGVDIADSAVAEATRLAREAGLTGISYRRADINFDDFPKNHYDVVFGIGSVHHSSRLEHLFERVSATLKPGGLFFLDEYVGPSQFQWHKSQLTAIDAHVKKMPSRYKVRVNDRTQLKEPVRRLSRREMNAIDPSEAIRSSEIAGLLPRYFDVLETKGQGGSLLHLLLFQIAGNFDEGNPEDMQYLQSLFEAEDQLIASGRLQHDFSVIIAAKRQ